MIRLESHSLEPKAKIFPSCKTTLYVTEDMINPKQ